MSRLRSILCAASLALAASSAPPPASAEPTLLERNAFRAAHAAATRGPPGRWQVLATGLRDYPLYPYLEAAALERDLAHAKPADVERFLAAHAGAPFAEDLRTHWLRDRAARRRWTEFLAAWSERSDAALRCDYVNARVATRKLDGLVTIAEDAWLAPHSLPPACDAVAAWLSTQRRMNDALLWRRIELAAGARDAGLIRALGKRLSPAQRADAARWAATIGNPSLELAKAATWPADARTSALVSLAFAQLARANHERAAALWPALEPRLLRDPVARGNALAAIALWKAANYAPGAAAWLARVPDAAGDDALREWRVRVNLAQRDYAAALKATALLSTAQQADSRWRYVRARLLEETGQKGAASAVLDTLANESNFHGFLAADRRGRPYSICPLEPPADAALRTRVARLPALVRAFELDAIDWRTHARREWTAAFAKLSGDERYVAVELAHARDWLDRGPLSLLAPGDVRYYELRFPLGYDADVRKHARRNGLEPAWVLGLIRSESAFMPDARSHADARGLMQVLPGTAKMLARTERVPYVAPADLFRPAVNIPLGTAFLRNMLARFSGRQWLATAAYNAGPTPVDRWLAQRPSLPTDLWIETIPYRETREYVGRVMAFSVIYDWRLGGKAGSLMQRLGLPRGAGSAAAATVVCALDAPAPAPAPKVAGR